MDQLSDLSVSNIYVYVGDAVRWDALPDRVAGKGLLVKTVAAGIHTPTSFASIISGLHPPQHGVWDFTNSLDEKNPNLLSLDTHNSVFTNTIDEQFNENPKSESIIDKMLLTEKQPPETISDVKSPFVYVERGPGGHAPYGNFPGNGWEYYRSRKGAGRSQYQNEYQMSVQQDIDCFESRLEMLSNRNLLDDTLVIYTSDHGELLGEGGCLGHNAPIHPKLAYVPTVFIHPTIENTHETGGILRHVDFFPTIAGLLETDTPNLPGSDLTTGTLSDQGACFYQKSLFDAPIIGGKLAYDSVWDHSGGYVYPRTSKVSRSIILLGKLVKSAKREYMRQHLQEITSYYLSDVRHYGEPAFSEGEGDLYIENINEMEESNAKSTNLNNASKERLKELGYLK